MNQVLSQVKSATGQSTVPQVFVGGRLLGGASDVVPLAESGQLAALLAASQAPPLPAELQALLPRAAAAAKAAQQQAEAAEGDPQCAQHRALAAAMRAALGSPGRTFALSAAADWLSKSQGVPTDGAAAALAQLQSAQLLTLPDAPATAVSQRLLATQPRAAALLVADAPAPTQWSQPLNGRFEWFGGARPAAEVGGAAACMRRGLARNRGGCCPLFQHPYIHMYAQPPPPPPLRPCRWPPACAARY